MRSMNDLIKRDIVSAKARAALEEDDDSEGIKAKNQQKILQVHSAEETEGGGGR
jgi:hypothetical protein